MRPASSIGNELAGPAAPLLPSGFTSSVTKAIAFVVTCMAWDFQTWFVASGILGGSRPGAKRRIAASAMGNWSLDSIGWGIATYGSRMF